MIVKRLQAGIPLLIGILASLVGFVTVSALRENRCSGVGGRWDAAMRVCNVDGEPLDVTRGADILAGIAVAVLLAFMLHRASTFARRFSRARLTPP